MTASILKGVLHFRFEAANQGNSNQSNQGGGRGFASMDSERQREIAAEGGRAAHASGNAHEFTSQEAREAGAKSHGGQGSSSQGSNNARGSSSSNSNASSNNNHSNNSNSGNTRGGSSEQHARAGAQSHKNDR